MDEEAAKDRAGRQAHWEESKSKVIVGWEQVGNRLGAGWDRIRRAAGDRASPYL